MKKKYFVSILLLMVALSSMAQEYRLKIRGRTPGLETADFWGTRCNVSADTGRLQFVVYFQDGTEQQVYDQENIGATGIPFDIELIFSASNPIIRVRRETSYGGNNTSGLCSGPRFMTQNLNFPCHNESIILSNAAMLGGLATIDVTPIVNLEFTDGTGATDVKIGCESETIQMRAKEDFPDPNIVYTWQFLDEVTSSTPVWKNINSQTGNKTINLALSELFPVAADRSRAIGRNILIRINPNCNIPGDQNDPNDPYYLVSNVLTINYLPEPPFLAGPKSEVTPPACNGGDGDIRLFFDRQIRSGERVNLNLLRWDGRDYTPVQSADNLSSFPRSDRGFSVFDFNDIDQGRYVVDVSTVLIGSGSVDPTCGIQRSEEIVIIEPAEVSYSIPTNRINPESCSGSDNGSFEITHLEGGPSGGIYQYSLDGGPWQNIPADNTISGLRPDTYTVRVGKLLSSNLCQASDSQDVVIGSKEPITHGEGTIVPPSAPGEKNASVRIDNVNGGTPIVAGARRYFDYTILTTTPRISGRADVNGFDIIGLPAGTHRIEYTDANSCTVEITLSEISDPVPITFDIEKEDPSCSDADDGTLTIENLRGGYSPYTISWTQDGRPYDTGLSITGADETYTVVVSDSRSGRVEINDITFDNVPAPIEISSIDIKPITCYGERSTVTIIAAGRGGDSRNYQYAISNGARTVWQDDNVFSLSARIAPYRFVIRDRNNINCVSPISSTITISQPSEIQITSDDITHNTIFGGSMGAIDLEISGGTPASGSPGYLISWTRDGSSIPQTGNSISGLQAGEYVATITDDESCSISSDVLTVNEPDKLEVTIMESSPILCNGDSGDLNTTVAGGSLSYSYTWFKDDVELSGENSSTLSDVTFGTYKVIVNDGFIRIEDSFVLDQPDPLSLSLGKKDVSCFGGSDAEITLTPQGGTRPYSFSIDDRATYILEDDLVNSLTFKNLSSGTYNVWLKDANGCEINDPEIIEIEQPLEIEISEILIEPATTVGGTNGSVDIEVLNGVGALSYTWTSSSDSSFLNTDQDLQNIPAGVYTVVVTDENDCTSTANFEVMEPLPMEVEIEITIPIFCHGDELGELLATVSGGFPIQSDPSDFEYRWYKIDGSTVTQLNTDLTIDRLRDISAGTYRMVARDSEGTEAETTFNLTQPEDLVVELDGDPVHVNCFGESTGSINVTVSGGPIDPDTGDYLPYRFSWTKIEDPGFVASSEDLGSLSAGTYELVVIDGNLCTTSLSEPITITEPNAPLEIVNVDANNLTGFQTGDGSIIIEINGGTKPYTFEWINNDDSSYASSSQNITDLSIGNYELMITDANDCKVTLEQEITEPNQLIIEILPLSENEEIQCNGGKTLVPLTSSTFGGIGSYTYEWFEQGNLSDVLFTESQTETLLAGTYVVVVTDENGNTTSDTYTVEEPDELLISESIINLSCNNDTNGSIDITVSGGVPPYLFRWSNGEIIEDINNVRAGTYSVEVTDDNFCTISKEIVIDQPNALFVSFYRSFPSSDVARDGMIIADVNGGIEPYQYEWLDEIGNILPVNTDRLENIGSEKYGLRVKDANNCELVVNDIDLYTPPVLEVILEEQNVVSCNGNTSSGSIIAIVNGGIPFDSDLQYVFQWYNAMNNEEIGSNNRILSGIGEGEYYATITDSAGTTITSSVFILQEPEILQLTFNTDYINCGNENDWTIEAAVIGGTAPYSYRWSNGDRANQIENLLPGTYGVFITDARGCTIENLVTVDAPESLKLDYNITIPTCYEGCDGNIALDIAGGLAPYTYQWSTGSTDKDLSKICAGEYRVTITDAKGCLIIESITIENPEQLIVELGEDITLCKDQSVLLDASISDPNASYQWNSTNGFTSVDPIIEVSEQGIYEVEVINSVGCKALGNVFIDTTNEVISADFIISTQVFVGEEFVVVNVSDPIPDDVTWSFPQEAQIGYEDNNYAEISIADPGEYEISMIIDKGLCTDFMTKQIVVVEKEFDEDDPDDSTQGLDDSAKFDYKIYPNPVSNGRFSVNITLPDVMSVSIKIFSMANNQLIRTHKEEGRDTYVLDYDLSGVTSGVYFVLLETEKGNQVRKLVIE